MVRGTYHAATSRRHTQDEAADDAADHEVQNKQGGAPPRESPPGTIHTHIRWMPKGRPQSIQSQRRSSSPFLMQAD